MPRRCATARRTGRWCGCPCATTDLPDPPGRARTGWARWPAAGWTVRTGTARLLPARRCVRRERRTPRWTTDRRCRPDTRRPPRPPRRPAARRRPARTRSSGPPRAPTTPAARAAAPRRAAPHRQPRPSRPRSAGRRAPGSAVTTCNCGQRACASRRRRPTPHPRRTGRRRTGDHAVGQRDRDRGGRRQTRRGRRGHRRPVHAPDGQHPARGPRHPPTARTGPASLPRALHGQPHPADPSAPGAGGPAPAPVTS